MRLLRGATLTMADPDAAMAAYVEWFDYTMLEQGTIGADLAAAWGAPAMEGRAYTIGRPASGSDVLLRFVAGAPSPDYRPLRTFGWAAIEICVQDTDAVHRRLAGSPFTIIGPPRRLDGYQAIYPMQVQGPGDEVIYLTQISADPPDCQLPRAACPIDQLFIVVLACSDMAASLTWFERTLGMRGGAPIDIVYTMLARAFALPIEQKHRIASGMDERDCLLEFDQYPPAATARPCAPGALVPGVALTTLWHRSIDTIAAPWIVAPAVYPGAYYGGARAGVLRGPDATLVEIIEVL